MIRSFGCPYTEAVMNSESPRRFPPDIIRAAYRKLVALANAHDITDMAVPPANRLEKLNHPKGYWSIRINQQWRIVFRWDSGVADAVKIVDYHSGKGKI